MQSLRVWSGWSCIPLGLPNERCTLLRYQRKASSPLHWSVSYHRQVWAVILWCGATSDAIGSSQRVSCLPTQKVSEASNWCCYQTPSHWNPIWRTRHIPSGFSTNKSRSHKTRLRGSTRSNGMTTPKMKRRRNMRNSCYPTNPSSFHRGNQLTSFAFMHSLHSQGKISFKGEGCNTPCYRNPN
jgi:hypothetical protein